MESLKRSASAEGEDALEVKRTRPADQLPPEVWELIFQNLSACWLRSVRLTCSRWDQIVRGSLRLMNQFLLTLTANQFSKDRKSVRELLARGGSYTQLRLAFSHIGKDKPRPNWFKSLGETVHTLSLQLTATEVLLAQLLKEMPNLRQLHLKAYTGSAPRSVVPDFRLDKLEELCLTDRLSPNMLSFCRLICSQLKVFKFHLLYWGDLYEQELVELIKSNCQTLRELSFKYAPASLVDSLIHLEDLHLTRLSIGDEAEDILRLIPKQPDLEVLRYWTPVTTPTLNEIIAALPKLKELQVIIAAQNTQQTLSLVNLSHIESLLIDYEYYELFIRLNLTDCHLSLVRHLSLRHCNISRDNLSDLQRTNVSTLTLENCSMKRLSDLRLLKTLNHLELVRANYFEEPDEPAADEASSSIRSLKMSDARAHLVLDAVKAFPKLERFVADGACIDVDILQVLSQRSPLLKDLICIRDVCDDFNALKDGFNLLPALKTLRIEGGYDTYRMAEKIVEDWRGVNFTIEINKQTCV